MQVKVRSERIFLEEACDLVRALYNIQDRDIDFFDASEIKRFRDLSAKMLTRVLTRKNTIALRIANNIHYHAQHKSSCPDKVNPAKLKSLQAFVEESFQLIQTFENEGFYRVNPRRFVHPEPLPQETLIHLDKPCPILKVAQVFDVYGEYYAPRFIPFKDHKVTLHSGKPIFPYAVVEYLGKNNYLLQAYEPHPGFCRETFLEFFNLQPVGNQ